MRNFFKLHPVLAVFLVVDFFVVIALVTVIIIRVIEKNASNAIIDVLVAPATAKVEINGEEYKAGPYKVSQGKVTAIIFADGFETKTLDLTLTDGETTKIYEYLEPVKGNMNYYAKNQASFDILKMIGSTGSEKIVKTISIRDVLPLTYFEYGGLNGESYGVSISEDANCDYVFCLLSIGDKEANHARTVKMIEEKGYNPSDYEIHYKNN